MERIKCPKIILSIVVPVYNTEKYVSRCLDSILNQTFQDFEIICVDDGSTDNSLGILRQYQREDRRIKIIHKENGGQTSARKAGILEASGMYSTCVDSDDWIECNMYARLISAIRSADADIVTSGCKRDYGNYCLDDIENVGAGVYEGDNLKEKLLGKVIDTENFFNRNLSLHMYEKIYKTQILKKSLTQTDEDIRICEDAVGVYLSLFFAKKIVVTKDCYYHYCVRKDSVCGVKGTEQEERKSLLALKNQLMQLEKAYCGLVNNLEKQFNYLYAYACLLRMPLDIIRYEKGKLYPFGEVSRGDRIVIYGAGKLGYELKEYLEDTLHFDVVAWVDKSEKAGVINPSQLMHIKFDKIIIATVNLNIVKNIKCELAHLNIENKKIIEINSKML